MCKNIINICSGFLLSLILTVGSAEAFWGGHGYEHKHGHGYGHGHYGHGHGYWGWGHKAPVVIVPWPAYPYASPYYDGHDGLADARKSIALGHQKIKKGSWLIRHGYPDRGRVLIAEGRALIDRGRSMLR
jgi:hypothetical protein